MFLGSQVAAPRSEASARQLTITVSCLSSGIVRVDLVWHGHSRDARQRWVDLTVFDNGWRSGTFIGSGPHGGHVDRLNWDGLVPRTRHFVRVNDFSRFGHWESSATYHFETPSCGFAQSQPLYRPDSAFCHPSYIGTDARSGGCIRAGIGDYDCLSVRRRGNRNGPNFASQFVQVIGYDEFNLDPDRDGRGCE
jgi:hypothetical protein